MTPCWRPWEPGEWLPAQPSSGSWHGDVEAGTGLTCMWVWLVTSGQSGWAWPCRLAQKWGPRDRGFSGKVPHQSLAAQLLSEFTQCLFGRDIRRRKRPS